MASAEHANLLSPNGNSKDSADGKIHKLDALIVGAGFGGTYQLKRLRELNYTVRLLEAGSDYGGVWYWNRYPGARVDSHVPHYEFSDPRLREGWTWKQRFPGSAELRAYFAYVAEKWDLRKDTQFDSFVESAEWDVEAGQWLVRTRKNEIFKVQFLLLNTGMAAKRHLPDWKGIDKFKGTLIHPSDWPHQEPNLTGKKIAIIGTGSTGVQLATELSKTASHLTVYQRTPNMALPMKQQEYNNNTKPPSPNPFSNRISSFAGFDYNFLPRSTFDDPTPTRTQTYQALWESGDLKFCLATYHDMLFDGAANREAYNFWRDKIRATMHDAKTADMLAPTLQPHSFGCKRVSLESGYFAMFNSPHVDLVDTRATPIIEITDKGVRTLEGEREFDFIVCATGFDAVTGGLTQIDIKGANGGQRLTEYWRDGVKTYLGLSVAGFPNLFFTYGPQGPTALCNGPTCAELQGDWVVGVIEYMREKSLGRIQARAESEAEWKDKIWELANATLLTSTKSWYMGDNIPGKPREPLIYLGGVPTYYKTINDVAANGYVGFDLA